MAEIHDPIVIELAKRHSKEELILLLIEVKENNYNNDFSWQSKEAADLDAKINKMILDAKISIHEKERVSKMDENAIKYLIEEPPVYDIQDLLSKIENVKENQKEANIAAAIIEDLHIPEDIEDRLRKTLKSFIRNNASLTEESDQIALRCAIRKFIFFQKLNDFTQIECFKKLIKEHSVKNKPIAKKPKKKPFIEL